MIFELAAALGEKLTIQLYLAWLSKFKKLLAKAHSHLHLFLIQACDKAANGGRGFKVLLGEIEAVLSNLDAITAAAVVDLADRMGNSQLVAYVTVASQPAPAISELRRALSQKLEYYMIPSSFVILDQLPLLPNGKVNRRALPVPTKDRPNLESPFIAPRTPVEKELANIWEDVLDLNDIGINDDFLDLGGDSLRAGQVISRVIKNFRVELPLRSLFEAPTVAEMSLVITQSQARKADPEQIERMLVELENLAEEPTKRFLAEESGSTKADGAET